MNISFIGLGNMGGAIASQILQGLHQLTVFNRNQKKMQPFVTQGAVAANSLAVCGENADVVALCLFDDNSVRETVKTILPAMKMGAICMDITTTSTKMARELTQMCNEFQVEFVSAKVLGIPSVVAAKQATALFGGSKTAFELLEPIFNTYCRKIVYTGEEPSTANAMKLACNYLLLNTIKICSELYALSDKQNIKEAVMHDFLSEVYSGHSAYKYYVDKIHNRNFDEVNFTAIGGLKDANLAFDAFAEKNIYPESSNGIRQFYQAAISLGLENKDWSVISEIQRHLCGLDSCVTNEESKI